MKAVLINKTDELGHHGCTLVNRQIDTLTRQAGIEIVAKLPLHSDWDALTPTHFDAVIVNGEGTLHSSSKGARRIAEAPAWARRQRASSHLINSVYQRNDTDITEDVALFDTIAVRDDLSATELSEAGIKADIVPDLSLTWQPEPATLNGTLHVNGSTLKDAREALRALSRHEKLPYLPILSRPLEGSERLTK